MSRDTLTGSDHYHHGDLRQNLLSTARELLEEAGPSGLSLREIARRVGVSAPSAYHHFSGLDSLAAALTEEGFRELAEKMEKTNGPESERLKYIGLSYVHFACEHPGLYRLMFGEGFRRASKGSEKVKVQRKLAHEHLTAVLSTRLPDDKVESGALFLWSVVHGLSLLLIDQQFGSGADRDEVIRKVLAAAGAGFIL